MYDTQPPYTGAHIPPPERTSQRFFSRKLSPKVPTGSYNIGEMSYELNLLEKVVTPQPRKMHCTMHSILASALDAGGIVPGQPELLPRSLENSFKTLQFFEFGDDEEVGKARPLVLKNRPPRWNKKVQCWRLNFHGRVTVSSVKNFQIIAAAPQPAADAPTPSLQSQPSEHNKVILQFGKVGKNLFTMANRYPLSA